MKTQRVESLTLLTDAADGGCMAREHGGKIAMELIPPEDGMVVLLPSLGRHVKSSVAGCGTTTLVIDDGSRRDWHGGVYSVKVPHLAQETV